MQVVPIKKSEPDSKAGSDIALSIVVPCFNEAENLQNLHRELTKVCEPIVEKYEIILINDGSRDKSWQEMKALASSDSHVVAIDLSRNFGHQIALSAGLSISRGSRVFTIDADLQDPPELLAPMMQLMNDGADVVYGRRISRDGETVFKKLSARIFYRVLSKLSDVAIPLDAGDFRIMRREVLDVLLAMPEQHRFIRGMVAWAGFKQVEFPYARKPRAAGATNYNLIRMVRLAVDAITGFSISPLRISLFCSLFFFAFAAFVLIYVLYSYIFLDVVAGWTSTAILISLFSAVQLLCLGIIGEYVGRIFLETKGRPLFVIREISGQGWPATRDS
jgi:glycosyltransferase involved in cell wall biosynthesis